MIARALWLREEQIGGTLLAAGSEHPFPAMAESGGGQLSLQSPAGIFGSRFDDVAAIMKRYAEDHGVKIVAPLQE